MRIRYVAEAKLPEGTIVIIHGTCRNLCVAQQEWKNRVARGTRPRIKEIVDRIGWGNIQFRAISVDHI